MNNTNNPSASFNNLKVTKVSYWRAPGLYWFLQALGWLGMIALETVNYTFFILGEFSISYVSSFVYFALIGIVVTHTLRYVLKRYQVFQRSSVVIWSIAALSAVLCSVISVILAFLPGLFTDFNEVLNTMAPIYVLGLIMNNGRYFLIWVAIYFLYEVLQQKQKVSEERFETFRTVKSFELQLLKKQINPHFLFNALNSIKALVLIDAPKSREAIIGLSELLRYTLNYEQRQLTTIADELVEVKKYFELEKLRYGKRLSVRYTISSETMNEFIPAVVLLTLAENAIKHGVAASAEKVEIEVKAEETSEGYLISISNTGRIGTVKGTGIGLRHITRQLEEHFGDNAVFTLNQQDDCVHAIIEIRQNGHQNTPDRRRTSRIRRTEADAAGF